jgi:hypothetical protein
MKAIVLDTGPLGGLVQRIKEVREPFQRWLEPFLVPGTTVVIPGIADYELRRELQRMGNHESIRALDELGGVLRFLPLDKASMEKACEYWAHARNNHQATSSDTALDGDMILCGLVRVAFGDDHLIATTNVKHISLYANAMDWQEITRADLH